MDEPTEALLAEQVAYYRARAQEFDEDMWQADTDDPALRRAFLAAQNWVAALPLGGQALELGCGTGAWTARLAACAVQVLAVDAAPEMLAQARHKLHGAANVTFELADIFSWEPPRRFDTVFFAFLLSHVPRDLSASFWHLVSRCLAPDGTVAFVDAAPWFAEEEHWLAEDVAQRRLRDGSPHRIVKRFPSPHDLTVQLALHGLDARVEIVAGRFLVGRAQPGGTRSSLRSTSS